MVAVSRQLPMGLRPVAVGGSDGRPICKQVEQTAGPVFLTLSRRIGLSDRRFGCELAFRGAFCVPTDHDYVGSGDENNTGTTGASATGRTKLAKCVLESSAALDREKMETDPSRLTVAANVEVQTSFPTYPLFGTVAHNLQRLSDRGYSPAVLEQLHRSRVNSTNLTYESKWKLFAAFCSRSAIDPFNASSPVVANFLTEIARDRSLSYSTIAGYRSAISRAILLTTGEDLSCCPILNQLMQSFKRSQPLPSKRLPNWDFSVVFQHLLSVDSSVCDLKTLTYKTVFLITLASGDRRSAVSALSRSRVRETEDAIILPYNDSFVPKSFFMRRNTTKIRELVLPFIRDRSRRSACPAETVKVYLNRTDDYRSQSCDALFLKHSNFTAANAQSISYYVKECIAKAYEEANLPVVTGRAHDVRKVAAALRSIANPSLNDVLCSGDWSSPTTYFKHYFFNINNVTCSTGRSRDNTVIAGRNIVKFSFQPGE